ncbi:MAG: nucleotidyltransferase domain-containing protein [Nanoarchaeota archaeon]
MAKENIILKTLEGLYGGYKANRENEIFRLLKLQNTSFILHESGCITFLAEKIMPQSIILFGSAAKGEDIEQSDIDLFIEGKETGVNLEKFEKVINRKINLFFKEDFKELSKELKNNIVNGIKLYGFLRAY